MNDQKHRGMVQYSSSSIMGSFSRRTRICVVGLLFASGRNAEALQNLFNAIQGGGSSAPAPLCKRVDVGTLSVSPMGLGTLNLPLDKEVDDDANDVLKAAVECDINFVDTAEAVSSCLHYVGDRMS